MSDEQTALETKGRFRWMGRANARSAASECGFFCS